MCYHFSRRKSLCLHTLRADCNDSTGNSTISGSPLPPHAPCRLQPEANQTFRATSLCLHTLRADCNDTYAAIGGKPPNFASTRSVQIATTSAAIVPFSVNFASTRSVQIATDTAWIQIKKGASFASTRSVQIATRSRTRTNARTTSFASTRSVQIATAEMHRMQYALFRTCVESVDSFSVLNKSMLR